MMHDVLNDEPRTASVDLSCLVQIVLGLVFRALFGRGPGHVLDYNSHVVCHPQCIYQNALIGGLSFLPLHVDGLTLSSI